MHRMPDDHWQPVTTAKLIGFGVGVVLFLVLLFKSEPGFIFLLDSANLLFHEAGHPIFGLFHQRLGVYGGTLGQLTFPLVLAVSFWRKGEPLSFAVSWIWFFENWLNIARYMADARAQVLPLVGGGDHDWLEIFGRWHVLARDTSIANITRTIGWFGMGVAVAWVVWRAWQDRNRKPAADFMAGWNEPGR